MAFSSGFSTPRNPFAGAAPLAHRPLSAIAATIAGGVAQHRIQRILAELIPTLEALHQNGRICGDISVHSVGLDEVGRAHLMALSSHVDSAERLRGLTSGYAPFELYTESSDWPLGPWTDVYGLSAVVYSLVSGQSPPAATERRVEDHYRPLTEMGLSQYTDEFLRGVDAGLSFNPVDRPQTMQAYAESLGLTIFAPTAGSLGEVVDDLPVDMMVGDESAPRDPMRAMIRMFCFGIATLGVAAYWWSRLAGDSERVITASEAMATYPNIDATPPFVAATIASPLGSDGRGESAMMIKEHNAFSRGSERSASSMGHASQTQLGDQPVDSALSESIEQVVVPTKTERKTPAMVKVSINVRPWGEIVIDGVSRGVTPPLKTVMLRPGKYNVIIRNSAREPYNTTLHVTADRPAVITHAFR